MSKRKTIDEFREDVKRVWRDRYTIPPYSIYTSNHNLIKVTCQKHGDFEITPDALLQGHGLLKVLERDNNKVKLSKENNVKLIYFIEKRFNKYMTNNEIYFNKVNDLIKYIENI